VRAQLSKKTGLFGSLSLLLLSACQGNVGGPAGPGSGASGGATNFSGGAGGGSAPSVQSSTGSGDFATGRVDPLACKAGDTAPGAMPGVVRLTHRQYDFAVKDLLGVDANATVDFVDDQEFFGFDNNAAQLSVPANQVSRYQATAERVAEAAAANLAPIKAVVSCVAANANAACRDRFLNEFLKLMLRRPLSDAERTRYSALFDAGKDLYAEGDAFTRGVRIVLEAVLQSPLFLYRAELRDTALDGRVVPLTPHELAARLSLTLWHSLPDAALMKKADDNALSTDGQLEAEVLRMLGNEKASRAFDDFYAQWLEFGKLRLDKDASAFPGYDKAGFEASAHEETLQFARYMSLEGTIRELFSAPMTFVDQRLAQVYGVKGPASGFAKVDLDPAQRGGLFTQLGFLAGHADPIDSSPIHRGAFVQKRVLCTTFGQLPANVGTLPARTADIVTTRDQVEAKTAPPQCQVCHGRINPVGFAFENFDSIGKFRTQDHGEDVNASDTLSLDGKDVNFAGAADFVGALAESETVRRCYETQWFRYGLGRGEADDDVCLLNEIDQRTQKQGGSIKQLVVSLTLSRGFRFRAQEDL
jgi:Protein of unknown function (DUF1592)/Protein of unknown function (DUF1588)/Protein of unknown function (DUF1587)/Protein of unknown function (DUF1595)/Protein of unknown function (DUF1585)